MKKCYLDSNFLIYLKDNRSLYHQNASKKLMQLISEEINLCISPLVLDEFLYVFRYYMIRKKIPNIYQNLKKAVSDILQIPSLSILSLPVSVNDQLKVISYMGKYRLLPRDAYHLLVMTSNNISLFATFDNDFEHVFEAKTIFKA